jgi:hypothetical protein
MNRLVKFAMGAVVAGGLAAAATAPAEAGISIGIGIGGPGHHYDHREWCRFHPGACGYYGGYYHPYADGYFVAGRGYWWHGGWHAHREWHGGGWRYR